MLAEILEFPGVTKNHGGNGWKGGNQFGVALYL